MWFITLPIALIVLFVVYQYVLLPKLNANHEKKMAKLTDAFAKEIMGKESDVKSEFIQQNENIKPISNQIQEQDIIGVISCQEKREIKDFVRQQAINMAGKMLKKATGVRVKEVDNTESYFLVLTQEHLHYLHYAENGRCKDYYSFKRADIKHMEYGEITSKDIIKHNAYVGETKKLSFEYDGSLFQFFIYNTLYLFPTAKNESLKEITKINYLFAKPFLEFISKN